MDQRDEGCKRFGRRLVSVRKRLALTQEALSADSGMSRSYLSGVENGRRNLGLLNIYRLADALGVLPLVLLDIDGVTDRGARQVQEPPAGYLAPSPAPRRREDFLAPDGSADGAARPATQGLEADPEAPACRTSRPEAIGMTLARRVAAFFPHGIPRRVDRTVMRAALLDLLDGTFVDIRQLAMALSRAPESLRGDYLRHLVEEGDVVLRYPHNPSHPRQAYIATPRRSRRTTS